MNEFGDCIGFIGGTPELPRAWYGGKGCSLGRLAQAGFPVPSGFVVATTAYQHFLNANELRPLIDRTVTAINDRTMLVAEAAEQLQSAFSKAKVPFEITGAIGDAYRKLGQGAVAVRSSATAEDAPGVSFAGQQDSFLNVVGLEAVIRAVEGCWSSLWTERSIRYREQMGEHLGEVAMAVIVQTMVVPDASGVLFTANPLTGDRTEFVVNASYGLGEAVVSGSVVPDTFVLDRSGGEPKSVATGTKTNMVVADEGSGTKTIPVRDQQRRELSIASSCLETLTRLAARIEDLMGIPQDVEWAISQQSIWILQARPITNLPPPPLAHVRWDPPRPGTTLVRRQVVENMPEPLSPLFDDLYLGVGLERSIDQFLDDFGITVDFELFMERPMCLSVNGYAYTRGSMRFARGAIWSLPRFAWCYLKVIPRLFWTIDRQWREDGLPRYLAEIKRWKTLDRSAASDEELLSGIRELTVADAIYWFRASIVLGGAKVTDAMLHAFLASRWIPGTLTSGMFLRGFSTTSTAAQHEIDQIAQQIMANDRLRAIALDAPIARFLDLLHTSTEGPDVAKAIDRFLEKYGDQVYNLDFAVPTLREDPTAVLTSLKARVALGDRDHEAFQASLVRQRDALIQSTRESIGPVRRWLFNTLLRWAVRLGPSREEALFHMGAAWTTIRGFALELGRRLSDQHLLAEPSDVFFLSFTELQTALSSAASTGETFAEVAERRRELREQRKGLSAPGVIPPGSRWKIGGYDMALWETQKRNADDGQALAGFAVSPGRITGIATVIRSPADFPQMVPGTILVCPTTTPAWTPLFAQASGLVTDIGGILAHGSIVAREYGIPAVLGTGNGSRRIVSGQEITVDGDAGKVFLSGKSSEDESA